MVPADAGVLESHLARASGCCASATGGDVARDEVEVADGRTSALVRTPAGEQRFEFPFTQAHNLDNALAAIAAGRRAGACRSSGWPSGRRG